MELTEKTIKRGIRLAYEDDGTLKGGDIAQVVQVFRGGEYLTETTENLVAIKGSVQGGIDVTDVMTEVQQDAVAGTNRMRGERNSARAERDAKCQECDDLQAQLDAANARIAELEAQA